MRFMVWWHCQRVIVLLSLCQSWAATWSTGFGGLVTTSCFGCCKSDDSDDRQKLLGNRMITWTTWCVSYFVGHLPQSHDIQDHESKAAKTGAFHSSALENQTNIGHRFGSSFLGCSQGKQTYVAGIGMMWTLVQLTKPQKRTIEGEGKRVTALVWTLFPWSLRMITETCFIPSSSSTHGKQVILGQNSNGSLHFPTP